MKKLMIKFKILFLIVLSTSLSVSAESLIEVGKTWWYSSCINSIGDGGLIHTHITLGITIKSPDSSYPEWFPCYAIDPLEENVIDLPVAHLKEKNGQVWVKPNLELSQINMEDCSNELEILSTFLGYWGGNKIAIVEKMAGEEYAADAIWNKDPEQTEFLLYDFNYKVDDAYKWPWSGINFYKPSIENDNEEIAYVDRGFFVTKIEDEEFTSISNRKGNRKIFNIEQAEEEDITYDNPISEIIEGVGITKGKVDSYYMDTIAWFGFFIAPASVSLPAFSGYFTLPNIPELKAVITADGTHIYGDPDYIPSAGIKETTVEKLKDNRIFNLHGCEVSNPLPGSIYIRNGKKFVAK